MSVGGKRAGAGRKKGVPNKATADVKALASVYSQAAVDTLAKIMREGESEAARVAAANAILDRAHGKPKQALIGGNEDDPPIKNELTVKFV